MSDANGASDAPKEGDVCPETASSSGDGGAPPISGAELLEDLASSIRRFVFVTPQQADTIALWVLSTWVSDAAMFAPRLAVKSAEKQSGKTTLIDVLSLIVRSPLRAANLTAAVAFRVVHAQSPTLLIDEADTFLADNKDLTGILNAGHRRGEKVYRCAPNTLEPQAFEVFSPAAIALIGKLPGTLEDRAIKITMRRATRDEKPAPLREPGRRALGDLAARCEKWAARNLSHLHELELPTLPDWLGNRAADNWEPLFAVATVAGADWPQRVERAARTLSEVDREDAMSDAVLLLSDLRDIFTARPDEPKLPSAVLCQLLNSHEDRPWQGMNNNRGITPNQLAKMLKPHKISPGTIRLGERNTPKGYSLKQFEETFQRYLPPETPRAATEE